MMRLLVPLALTLCLVAAGVAWSGEAGAQRGSRGSAFTHLSLAPQTASGVHVFHLENHAGFGEIRYWINGTRDGDFRPWHVQFIEPDGNVVPFLDLRGTTSDGDHASSGQGDGVVYAGVDATAVQTPDAQDERQPLRIAWADALPGTKGNLVIAWANQVDPITFELRLPPGTNVKTVAAAPLEAYEMKDFEGGVRAGVPAAALAHAGDGLRLDPGNGQLWGYMFYMRSTAAGHGNVTLRDADGGWARVLSLDAAPRMEGGLCVCSEWGRWVFTRAGAIDVTLEYVGDGARTHVVFVAAVLPSGTLPDGVWQEFDLT